LKLAPLTDEWRQRLHIGKTVKGVVVTAVADNSPLAELGFEPGDVIQAINQQPTTTPQEVAEKLKTARDGKGGHDLLILLNRHGVNQYVALSMPPKNG
jgi:serine protease Do